MAAELRQILRMVTIEIVINSIRVMGVRVAMPVCVVLHGLVTGRIAAKRQTAGIKTHRPKIRFSPLRGDSLHWFTSNLTGPTGTWVRLAVQNFTSIITQGVGMRPQNIKIFHFLVKSRPARATPLTDFENVRRFYESNYPTLVFQIWHDSLHRLLSYCWETARQSIRPNFSVHPVGKTMRWIEKKWLIPV